MPSVKISQVPKRLAAEYMAAVVRAEIKWLRRPLFAANLIGILYTGIGVFGLVYRAGDPFMAFFVCLGGVLLLSGYALASPGSPTAH